MAFFDGPKSISDSGPMLSGNHHSGFIVGIIFGPNSRALSPDAKDHPAVPADTAKPCLELKKGHPTEETFDNW